MREEFSSTAVRRPDESFGSLKIEEWMFRFAESKVASLLQNSDVHEQRKNRSVGKCIYDDIFIHLDCSMLQA